MRDAKSSTSADGPAEERNLLERFLSLFADVKAGEGLGIVVMLVNVFLLLNAYYVLKTVREGLMVAGATFGLSGAMVKILSAGVMALLLLFILPAYGQLASRVTRMRLINICYAVTIACLIVFLILARAGVPLAIPFFLWLGIVSVFLVSLFWSYSADIYTEEQGKRVFAIIALGGSVGAVAGPQIAKLGTHYSTSLVIAVGILGGCVLLYNLRNRMRPPTAGAGKAPDNSPTTSDEGPLGKEGGFQLIFRQRYLLLIALMLIIANLVNTTGEFILTSFVEQHALEEVPDDSFADIADPDARRAEILNARALIGRQFYGDFFSLVNLIGVLVQAFVVSRIFKHLGVRTALFFLPVIAMGAYAAIALVGGLGVLRVGKIAENSTDYSLQNTVRQALFLPTSREAKYKAKAAIDTFFVRIGDSLAAAVVTAGTFGLSLSPRAFATSNVVLIIVWLLIAVGIAREHKKLSPDDRPDN